MSLLAAPFYPPSKCFASQRECLLTWPKSFLRKDLSLSVLVSVRPHPLAPSPAAGERGSPPQADKRGLDALLDTCSVGYWLCFCEKAQKLYFICLCEGRQPRGNLGWGGTDPSVVWVTMVWHKPYPLGMTHNDYRERHANHILIISTNRAFSYFVAPVATGMNDCEAQ